MAGPKITGSFLENLEHILNKLIELITEDPLRLVGAIIAALLITVIGPIRRALWSILTWTWRFIFSVFEANWRMRRAIRSATENASGTWLAIKPVLPPDHENNFSEAVKDTPVLVIANLKGGVGKTTIAANLAAKFASSNEASSIKQKRKPVLAIDLDFQGSLSSLMFSGVKWRPAEGEVSNASKIIQEIDNPNELISISEPATWLRNPEAENPLPQQITNLRGISAFHDLADSEDTAKLLWVLGEIKGDIRYRLYELLHNREIRDKFSAIVIDAPPRLTTGCVQALAAGTHLLIPTILDELSAASVGFFGKQLRRYDKLWPELRVIGIVGSKVEQEKHESTNLRLACDTLRLALRGTETRLDEIERSGNSFEIPYKLSVVDRSAIAKASKQGIAYVTLGNNEEGRFVRRMFDAFADEVERRMNI